ncbi:MULTISPECIES: hypothetical protein [Photorhabdus]|uniref:hypothetical protein n=1 Tax=Photorhabdus TaxID=29487 RepID=UPI001EFE6AC1|nr:MULTISPECIES: hypothetical protein [Photorhabdus]MCT8341412.1 hypothetical protein [Photorhabdus kleinii]
MNIFIQYFNKLRSISPKFDIMPNTNYFYFIPQKSDADALADDLDKVRADFAAVLKQFNDEIILSTGKETIYEPKSHRKTSQNS